jgi:predicted ATPase
MTAVEHGINFFWNLQALFKQQIKDAYNQGYRDGLEDWNCEQLRDVAECCNAEYYYKQTFNK